MKDPSDVACVVKHSPARQFLKLMRKRTIQNMWENFYRQVLSITKTMHNNSKHWNRLKMNRNIIKSFIIKKKKKINNNFYEKQYFLGFPRIFTKRELREKNYKKAHEKKIFRITHTKITIAYFITSECYKKKLFDKKKDENNNLESASY